MWRIMVGIILTVVITVGKFSRANARDPLGTFSRESQNSAAQGSQSGADGAFNHAIGST